MRMIKVVQEDRASRQTGAITTKGHGQGSGEIIPMRAQFYFHLRVGELRKGLSDWLVGTLLDTTTKEYDVTAATVAERPGEMGLENTCFLSVLYHHTRVSRGQI
jgi:hypothetical protein